MFDPLRHGATWRNRRGRRTAPDLRERIVQYALLMRVHRPIGSLLLLWPTLWALWIAGAGGPDPGIVLVFVAGVFVMRSAGCVINDYADRRIDPHVWRTKDRPIASGKVEPREALALFTVLCLVGFGLVLTLNGLAVLLSFAGAALAAGYPFMKRWTHLPCKHQVVSSSLTAGTIPSLLRPPVRGAPAPSTWPSDPCAAAAPAPSGRCAERSATDPLTARGSR